MNISFDLDDTLILHPQDRQTHTRERLLLTGEYLRRGTTKLLKDIAKGHRLYIYTSSLRPPWQLIISFLLKGIRIHRVINAELHDRIIDDYGFKKPPTKLPSHFGIDLHIDDSPGVVAEGLEHGFTVLRIDPDDIHWTETVHRHLNPVKEEAPGKRDPDVDTSIYH